MIAEAYELFGCNTADLFVMSIATGDDNAACIAFDELHGIEFPTISGVEGGGTQICNTYGIGAYPTYILIAPDHSVVENDIWPMPSVQTLIDAFESNGITQAECGGLSVNFISDNTEICQYDMVSYTDLSSASVTSWTWTFEGGDPATSTEQNPIVVYNEAGNFDVTLEVSDGTNTNLITMDDYIAVTTSPPAMLLPFDDVCDDDPAFELTGGSPTGGVYSGPGVTNNWFDPVIAGLGTHTIIYTYTASSTGCDNSAEETVLVDVCSGINPQLNTGLNIFPNPSSGKVNMEFEANGKVSIQVINILGVSVYQNMVTAQGQVHQMIDLSNLESGLYFISIKTKENTIVQKLKLNAN